MRVLSFVAFSALLPQVAWADCVYTGAKRAYLECIYGEVAANASALADAAADLLGLDGRLGAAEADLQALSDEAAALQTDLGGARSDLDALATRVGFTEGDIDALFDQLAALSDETAVANTGVGALNTSVGDLSTSVGSLSTSVSSLSSAQTSQAARITSLETQVAALTAATGGLRFAAMHCHWNGTTYDDCQSDNGVNGSHTRMLGFRLQDKPTVAAGYTGLVAWPIPGAGSRDPHCVASSWYEHAPGTYRIRTDATAGGLHWACSDNANNNVSVGNCVGWQTWICMYDT